MKKICFVLLLMLPVVASAQKATSTQKETTKYEDLVSKSGVVSTTYRYRIGVVELVWNASTSTFTDKLVLSIEKMIIGNTSTSFLNITHTGYDEASFVMIEESNVKELYNSIIKLKELGNNPVPEGAIPQYSYLNNDGVFITYDGEVWRIQLDKFSKDKITASNIDPLIAKLQEVIQKFETIK